MTLSYYQKDVGFKAYEYNDRLRATYEGQIIKRDFSNFFDQIDIGENDTLYLSHFQRGYLEIPLHEGKEPEIVDHIYRKREGPEGFLGIVNKKNYQKAFTRIGMESANMDYSRVKVNDGKISCHKARTIL